MPNVNVKRPHRAVRNLLTATLPLLLLAGAAQASGTWEVISRAGDQDLRKVSFTDDSNGWVAGDAGTIAVTKDGGRNWDVQDCPIDSDIIDIQMVDRKVGWALGQYRGETSNDYKTTVLRTINGGDSWHVQATFPALYHAIGFASDSRGAIAGEAGRILFTVDSGNSWNSAQIEAPDEARWSIRNIDFHSPSFGLAMGGQYDVTGVIWKTVDGGATWTHLRVCGEPVFASYAFDQENIIAVGGDLDYGAGMVTTSRAGESWDFTDLGIWGQAEAVTFRDSFEGWVPLGFAGTMMVTMDSGHTWTTLSTPDGSAMHDAVFTSADHGIMVGEAGTVIGYTASGPTAVAELGTFLGEVLLEQNSPNPFRPETTFAFRVPAKSAVSLKVYDSAGREVATIVDEPMIPGAYQRTFDGSELASGVYYYRLTVGKHVETKKMVVLR
ncbi:T9SS type A sorting domain-containing protein [bacterium]|nr:T9SS type A sorting domain-containing protein [bacterium]